MVGVLVRPSGIGMLQQPSDTSERVAPLVGLHVQIVRSRESIYGIHADHQPGSLRYGL